MNSIRTSPLSSAQLGLWFKHQMAPQSMAFDVDICCRLRGELEPDRLQQAIQAVANGSDALRTFFGEESGEPVQHVRDSVHAPVEVHRRACGEQAISAWAAQPFDITADVLFETLLIEESPGCWTWRTRVSHLVLDGVGIYAYVDAVAQAYDQLKKGCELDLSFLGSYGEHLEADAAYRASSRWQKDRAYWLARHPTPAEPVFRPGRGADAGLKFRREEMQADRYQPFLDACRDEGLPAASVLASIVALVALRQQGRTDFPLAIASHNRSSAHRATLGMFSGYLPFRIDLNTEENVVAMAQRVDAQLRRDLRCRMFTAAQLAGACNSGEDTPAFDLVFSHVHCDVPAALGNVQLQCESALGYDSDKVFLLVQERNPAQATEITLAYPPHLADEAEVQAFFAQFLRLVGQWADMRQLRTVEVPLLDTPERERLVAMGNGTRHAVAASSDVLSRFDSQARARPDAIALACHGATTSYGQLHERSLLLAAHLRSLGVGPDSVVAVRLDRGEELVVALLSILRAQGAYLPLDTSIPRERLDYMLENSGACLLLTTSWLAAGADEANVVCLDGLALGDDAGPAFAAADEDQLAYVIYTSGSTGKPKGVQISRGALANAMASFEHDLKATHDEVFLSTTGISFDIFGLELFLPLCVGATLILADRERLLEAGYLVGLASKHSATLFQATPSLVSNLLDSGWRPDSALRLLVGGEALTTDVAQRLASAAAVLNVYGPTEATIWASVYRLEPGCDRSPPIGQPIWNTQFYVLDGFLNPVPVGVGGELYIGGGQLARGYAARADLTAERFIPSPFVPGQRIYRTGDLVRWRADGHMEYLGRADQQVKIRGHRIEPGEIEAVLASHPAIAAAVVLPRDDMPGGTQLVAYYTPAEQEGLEGADAALAEKQTAAWHEIYDDRYAQDASQGDLADAAVWTNSYSGQPYREEDIREWAESTVERIAALRSRRVLEIGCGSGLLMSRLAPETEYYVGTDISGKALELLAAQAQATPQIKLMELPAHGIGALAPRMFDLIIINSVVQYFPGAAYLLGVLDQAHSLLAPGGYLFVGDVRNLALLPAFHASIELHKAAPNLTNGDLLTKVKRQCRHEGELCLDPGFFATLAGRYGLHSVQVLSRRGHADTEMNAFRFDAILQRTGPNCLAVPQLGRELRWQPAEWTIAHLEAILQASPQVPFIIRGLPDARVSHGLAMLETAGNGSPDAAIGSGMNAMQGMHPETAIAAAQRMDWSATVRATAGDGSFDVLLSPAQAQMRPLVFAEPALSVNPSRLAGNPLAVQMQRVLEEQLRQYMGDQLPDYMVPAFFVPLEHLPLTTNGKLDRRALPKPEELVSAQTAPPRDDTEARVAEVMARVLGLSQPPGRDASFFALGGHSLAAVRLVAQLREAFGTDVNLKVVFESPTVAGLATRVREAGKDLIPPLVAHNYPPTARLALSASQEAMWFLDRLEGPSAVYNMPYAFRLEGQLDAIALEQAFTGLIDRHSVLRTSYSEEGGTAFGTIRPAQPFGLQVVEVQGTVDAHVRELARTPFDLGRDLMLRAHLLRVDSLTHVLVMVIHHIAADGLSMDVLSRELVQLYDAARAGQQPELAAMPTQYADFAYWQRHWPGPDELQRQLDWWRFHLQDAPEVLNLPADRARPAVSMHRGNLLNFRMDATQRQRVEALADEHAVTPFTVLLSAYGALLSRLSGQAEVVVGTPVGGRRLAQLEGMIGLFVNALPLRLEPGSVGTGAALLRATYEVVKDALSRPDVPFDRLVQHLGAARSLNHMPVFQTMFSYLAQDVGLELPGLQSAPVEADSGTARFDLTLQLVADASGGYTGTIEFDTDLFDASTIGRWASHYQCLLDALTQNPGNAVADLPLLDSGHCGQMLVGWNRGRASVGACPDFVELFDRQVRLRPDAVAAVCEADEVTYGDLDAQAGRLARHLYALGARADMVIAIYLDRGIDLIVAMLAVMKTGAAFLPLDTALPQDRLAYMLGNSRVRLALSSGALMPAIAPLGSGVVGVDIRTTLPPDPGSHQVPSHRDRATLAYSIYTSGSTGQPKGVEITHHALAVFIQAYRLSFEIRQSDVALSTASISFDMFLSETLPFLCEGATVVLADRQRLLDKDYFSDLVVSKGITVTIGTPSFIRNLLDSGWAVPETLRVMVGGETVPQELVQRLCATTTVWNAYGPTECTIAQSAAKLELPLTSRPSIGGPLAGSCMYVLDARLNPVPVGVPGELYIGGEQLARGYAARPALTAERFIPNPFIAGERLYRTGDLVCWRPDGVLDHLGRADFQVKIRGYRIELGEIEKVLAEHDDVVAAAVVAHEDECGDKRLVAYIVGKDGTHVPAAELQALAGRALPPYMVPSAFMPLDRLPTNRNGKLDTRALPAPSWSDDASEPVADLNPTEQRVAQLMAQVLSLDAIARPQQSFFALGGHSLSAVRLTARLREAFGVEIRLKSFFETPTVAGLAALISSHDATSPQSPFVCFGPESERPPLFIVHGADGNAVNFRALGERLAPHAKVYGIDTVHIWQPQHANEHRSVEHLAQLYGDRILSDFPGLEQIHLGGWSFGGLVALEMARYLTAKGRTVVTAFAVDSALHWAATDLLAMLRLGGGFEPVARQHLLKMGHGDDEIQALLADKSSEGFLARLSGAFKANALAASQYRPSAWDGDFSLILADKGTAKDALSVEGWREALGSRLEESTIEGTHWSILQEPGVEALSAQIAGLLIGAQEVAA
ncbi:MAG: amino acid adenylation domain-containing protein [Burkholderiaceae bacterium]|nr:amino acid adenylation domain-containing protein [Burkholderiaceae bacterium]